MCRANNGVEMMLAFHSAFKEMSLEKNFKGNKIGVMKGYTTENLNSNKSIAFDNIDEKTLFNKKENFLFIIPEKIIG